MHAIHSPHQNRLIHALTFLTFRARSLPPSAFHLSFALLRFVFRNAETPTESAAQRNYLRAHRLASPSNAPNSKLNNPSGGRKYAPREMSAEKLPSIAQRRHQMRRINKSERSEERKKVKTGAVEWKRLRREPRRERKN